MAAGVFVFAEVTWWLAIPLLGKEIIDLIKSVWPRLRGAWQYGLTRQGQKAYALKQRGVTKIQAEKNSPGNSMGGV